MTINLYAVLFTHYAPKDSEEGISQYIAAPGDSEVLKRLGILKDEVK